MCVCACVRVCVRAGMCEVWRQRERQKERGERDSEEESESESKSQSESKSEGERRTYTEVQEAGVPIVKPEERCDEGGERRVRESKRDKRREGIENKRVLPQ